MSGPIESGDRRSGLGAQGHGASPAALSEEPAAAEPVEREDDGASGDTEPEELPWEDWADGDVWRIKRGKHYRAEAQPIEERALEAAARMGKAVRTYLEVIGKREYLWLQFADREIELGEPCGVCGGRELVRLHQYFARCESCGSKLLLKMPKD